MSLFLVYLVPLGALWALIIAFGKLKERRVLATRAEEVAAGLTEPASLHPKIDPIQCIGCGTCVSACPEGEIIGLVNGRAELIMPSHCIGHGACAAACPIGAIELVFGTEKRGVDIPNVGPDFQTNVPGIYIAGELGGMGLIRNAIEQGRQATAEIVRKRGERKGAPLDLVIVGSGPAGISSSLAALEARLNFVTLEQETLGGTVSHFPRGKLVMTAPAQLPLYGMVNLRETSKEALLAFWQNVVDKNGLKINFEERVDRIERAEGGFRVITPKGEYHTAAVLLTIGRRGTPRKLGVEGEEHEKVVYRLIDPAQYAGRSVLVVGGGDSAIEAATSIAEEKGTTVVLSYRGDGFSRAKGKNRDKIEAMDREGRLRVIFGSTVSLIEPGHVTIERDGVVDRMKNDAVIVCAGGILPTPFLKSFGVEIETKYGTA